MADEMGDPDGLAYGVVVDRLESGDWWHGHLVAGEHPGSRAIAGRMEVIAQRHQAPLLGPETDVLVTHDASFST